ncbi:MAG: hypothetical protein JO004_02420 [Methylobacteriaceae bacterium]|nr:hypothetical protein [Methylobacteriaceae bacterium]
MRDELSLKDRIGQLGARIAQNQNGSNGRFVLFRHDATGLGAQISRRALALRVGLMTGRTAIFPDEDFYPYQNAFEPLSHVQIDVALAKPMDLARFEADDRDVVSFDFWEFWGDEDLKRRVYDYVPEELKDLADPGRAFEGVSFGMFALTPAYKTRLEPYLDEIRRRAPIVGVHFRRGDKYVETPYVTVERYRRAIDEVARRAGSRRLFISSDSPKALSELGLQGADYDAFFDTEEKRYNNANHKFLMKNREYAPAETFTAIKNIYMLAHCQKVVGQTNAHFGSLAAGQILARSASVDYGELLAPELPSKASGAGLAYAGYQGLRAVARRLLPSRTLQHLRRPQR